MILIIKIIYSLLGKQIKINNNMEEKIDLNYTQIDMVQKLTLGLHLITKRIDLCIPNSQ